MLLTTTVRRWWKRGERRDRRRAEGFTLVKVSEWLDATLFRVVSIRQETGRRSTRHVRGGADFPITRTGVFAS